MTCDVCGRPCSGGFSGLGAVCDSDTCAAILSRRRFPGRTCDACGRPLSRAVDAARLIPGIMIRREAGPDCVLACSETCAAEIVADVQARRAAPAPPAPKRRPAGRLYRFPRGAHVAPESEAPE